jgi:hypothetical protein
MVRDVRGERGTATGESDTSKAFPRETTFSGSGSNIAHQLPMTDFLRSWNRGGLIVVFLASSTAVLLSAAHADAQIKEPGAHRSYSVELEPHALLLWRDHARDHWDDGSGYGLGMRASIPIVENGFVSSINNSVAIGFGLDWGRYSHRCWLRKDREWTGDCTNDEFLVPVVMQWNFYFTQAFSVFGEPGLAIRHSRWSWPNGYCDGPNGVVPCDYSDNDTDVEPVLYLGGRLGNDDVSFTFRVGWPYASVGASFFL